MKERALRHGAFVQHLHNSSSLQSPTVNQTFLMSAQTTATVEFITLWLVSNCSLTILISNKYSIMTRGTPYGTMAYNAMAYDHHTCYILIHVSARCTAPYELLGLH